jgi:hypothetical protein
MRNPKISAARSARAEYRQKLKRLEREASDIRAIYAQSLKELAIAKFLKLYPRENWPEWIDQRAEFKVKFDKPDVCKVSIVIKVHGQMPEGHFWEDGWLQVRHDDGKLFVVIHCNPLQEVITIFEAQVDPESLAVTFIIDRDPSTIDRPPLGSFYDEWQAEWERRSRSDNID